jgi:hypothetical protein
MAPSTPGSHGFNTCTMSENFYVNLNFSGQVVITKRILEISFLYNSFPYHGLTRPLGAMVFTTLNLYYVIKLSCEFQYFLAKWFFFRRFLKYIFYINICKNYCGPTRPTGALILTNFNLQYVWKLPYKLQLSWSCFLYNHM